MDDLVKQVKAVLVRYPKANIHFVQKQTGIHYESLGLAMYYARWELEMSLI